MTISIYLLLFTVNGLVHCQAINDLFPCLKTDCSDEVRIEVTNDPSLLIDQTPHTPSIQHHQSTSVSVKTLLSQILENFNDNHGILIVEAGKPTEVRWSLSFSARTIIIEGLSTYSQPQLQIALSEHIPIYQFDSTLYEYYPRNLLFVKQNVNISYNLLSETDIDCRGNALVFAVILWNKRLQDTYNESVNFEASDDCQACENLLISRDWIRMCPFLVPSENQNYSESRDQNDLTVREDLRNISHADSCYVPTSTEADLTTSSTITTTISRSVSLEVFPKLRLTDDLRGLFADCGLGDMSNFGFIRCDTVFEDITKLGTNPTCEGSKNGFLITFGKNATVKQGQKLQLQQCSPAQSLITAKEQLVSRNEVVIVDEPLSPTLPSFMVSYPDTILNCDTTVRVEVKQIQGNGDRDLEFRWNIVDEHSSLAKLISEEKSRCLELPGLMIDQNISLSVQGCNYGGKCTKKDNVRITVVKSPGVFRVSITGIPKIVYPSSLVRLQAVPEFKSCNRIGITPKNVEFEWSINNSVVSVEDNYRIPSYKFYLKSKLNISIRALFVESSDSVYVAHDTTVLTYEAEPLYLSLDSAYSREHPIDRDLLLDADACRDYNSIDAKMSHQWKCEIDDLRAKNKSCGLSNSNNWEWNRSVLEISAFMLAEGTRYKFTNFLTSSNALNGSIETIVTITEAESPLITVQPMKEKEDNQDYIRIQAFVSSIYSPLNVTWTVTQSQTSKWFDINHILSNTSTIFRKLPSKSIAVSLTIPPKNLMKYPKWTGLKPSSKYILRLLAHTPHGTSNYDVTILTAATPRTGKVEVNPRERIVALQTLVKFEVGDGWDLLDSGKLLFRFGLTTIHTNRNNTIWMPQSSARVLSFYLPSAWPDPIACHDRIGSRAVLEACNEGTCRITESEPFSVAPSQNRSQTTENILSLIKADIKNRNFFPALAKLYALELEQCDERSDHLLVDQTILQLLKSIDSTSSSLEYREVLHFASSLLDYVSKDVVNEVVHLIQTYRTFVGKINSTPGARRRRSVPLTKSSSDKVNEAEAAAMLEIADNILGKNVASAVDLYFITISDFLIGFCTQLDEKVERIMKATGKLYTKIQAQSINPNIDNFNNRTFSTAGILVNNIAFTDTFKDIFKQWTCGEYTTCYHVCLATARISIKAAAVNQQLQSRFYLTDIGSQTLNKSVSDLYRINFLDPMNGNDVFHGTSSVLYNVLIPIMNYQAASYYACHVIVDNAWSNTVCEASDYPVEIDNLIYQQCFCNQSGVLGVFKVHPPTPFPVPANNEIVFTFTLTRSDLVSKDDVNSFITRLVWATGLTGRLVNPTLLSNETQPVINVTLRPPFRPSHISNSYATQAILKSVSSMSGFKAFGNVSVADTSYFIKQRKLEGDSNARKIMMFISGSYNNVVGNSSETLAQVWAQSIAETLEISSYRIRNAIIVPGIIFNFTITKPFKDEKNALNAEEIALMLSEQVAYKEYNLQSVQGESLAVELLTEGNIILLIARTEPNTLALILIVIVSTWIFLCLLVVGGASIVKIRTERAVLQERQRVTALHPTDRLHPPLPRSPNTLVNMTSIQMVGHRMTTGQRDNGGAIDWYSGYYTQYLLPMRSYKFFFIFKLYFVLSSVPIEKEMSALKAVKALSRPFVFGMIHVPALPMTPGNKSSMQDILRIVRRETAIYADSGIDGIIIENMHDIPYVRKPIGPEIVSGMSLACQEVVNVLGNRRKEFILGVQILAGCNEEAVAVAHNTGYDLVRAECFVFSHVADEGWMDGCAGPLLRYRKSLKADVSIITDIKKKHSSHSVTSDLSIEEVAQAAEFFLADGVIVTGNSTGKQADPKDLVAVKRSCRLPVFVGSGVCIANLHLFQEADGLIAAETNKAVPMNILTDQFNEGVVVKSLQFLLLENRKEAVCAHDTRKQRHAVRNVFLHLLNGGSNMNSDVSVESMLQSHASGNKTLKENLRKKDVPIADLIDFDASVSTPTSKPTKSVASSSPPTAQSTHLLD